MAEVIPTTTEIHDSISTSIQVNLPDSNPSLRNSVFDILSWATAEPVSGLHKVQKKQANQKFISLADDEWLDVHGVEYDLPRAKATKSAGTVIITGSEDASVVIGVTIVNQGGTEFLTTESVILTASGTANITVESKEAGIDNNILANAPLFFSNTPAGINQAVVVDSNGILGGTDTQNATQYRESLLFLRQNPPMGGNYNDYIRWTKEALKTATRVYPMSNDQDATIDRGDVNVYFMMDDSYLDGIPQAGDVTIVTNYLNQSDIKPITMQVTALAPTAVPLNFDIQIDPYTPEVEEAIEASLLDFIRNESSVGGTLWLSRINEAISISDGEFNHILVAPVANEVVTKTQISTAGTFAFSAVP